jgi:hypothetical protein
VRLTPVEPRASRPARSRGRLTRVRGRRAVRQLAFLVALLALSAAPVAASGRLDGGSPGAGAVHGAGPVEAIAGLPVDPAGDLADLPETDTEVQNREAPPLEILLLAAGVGLGLAFYVSRRPRRPG